MLEKVSIVADADRMCPEEIRKRMNLELLLKAFSDDSSILCEDAAIGVLATLSYDLTPLKDILGKTRLSDARARRIMTRLYREGYVGREEKPHPNPGMPGTYFYHLAPELPLAEIRRACHERLRTIEERCGNLIAVTGGRAGSVAIAMSKIRSASRQDHLNVLKLLAEVDKISANELSNKLGIPLQTMHARLGRLKGIGLVRKVRPVGATAYEFSLSDAVGEADRVTIVGMTKSDIKSEKDGTLRLPRLPEFDEGWPDSIKEKWFNVYKLILDAEAA